MEFGLSEDQVMLQETVRRFVAEEVSLDLVRQIAEGEIQVAETLAEKLTALGLDGLLVPEKDGGSGLGVLRIRYCSRTFLIELCRSLCVA